MAKKKIWNPKPREKTVEGYLLKQMQAIGGDAIKFPQGEGLPDRLCVHDGKSWFVETKTINGVLSDLQIERHAKLKRMGFDVYVLWTKEQVNNFINHVVLQN